MEFPSPAEFLRQYRIQCALLHAECRAVPFNQLWSRDRALAERAPISKCSGYKTGLVLDILALCYSHFLVLQLRKEARNLSTGLRATWTSLPPICRHPSQRLLKIVQSAYEQSSALLGCRTATDDPKFEFKIKFSVFNIIFKWLMTKI